MELDSKPLSDGKTLPGWRDFERSVALAFQGKAQESKAVFDVLMPDPARPGISYGASCKMRRMLDEVERTGRAAFELSNSARQFWASLAKIGLTQANYRGKPKLVGRSLIRQVERWHQVASSENGGQVDISQSFYLVLLWSKSGWYQLFQFPLQLPSPNDLRWYFPVTSSKGVAMPGRRIVGDDAEGTLLEWYGESGGQLKYYPLVSDAVWTSERFQLERLPSNSVEYGILAKASSYFPDQWAECAVPDPRYSSSISITDSSIVIAPDTTRAS